MSRHEKFCWWLGGFLRAQGVQGTPNLATLDAIRAELASALLTGQLASDDGLSPSTLESLGGPWRKTIVGVDLGSKPSETVYTEWGERNLREPQVARAPLSVPERVAALEVQTCNTQHNEKLSVQDRQKLSDRIKSLEDKPRGVLVSAFDLLNNHVHKLEKRLYDLEQLPKPSETYREAFTRGWDNAKDKVASLNEHQQKQAREQGKLGDRIGELEAQLKKAQDMAGSMHDDKERRLKRLEVPDTQRHIRDLQRWQTGVNTSLCDIKNKADTLDDVATNLHKRLHDVEQAISPKHAQGQLDAAFMAQRGHVASGLASALNNQAMSAELNKHRETFAPQQARPLWNEHSDDSASYLARPRGIGDPEDKS